MSVTIIRPTGDFYQFDASVRVSVAREARATQHPVEDGADPSDHLQPGPRTWTMTCVVAEGSGNAVTPIEMQQVLDQIVTQREVLTIDVPRLGRSYGNVVLEGFSVPITPLRSFTFQMRFKEIRRAVSEIVRIPASQPVPAAGDVADETDGGKQPTTEADEQQADNLRDQSLLSVITGIGA